MYDREDAQICLGLWKKESMLKYSFITSKRDDKEAMLPISIKNKGSYILLYETNSQNSKIYISAYAPFPVLI